MRYNFNKNCCSPEKFSFMRLGLLGVFVPNTCMHLFKVYFQHTGCPKTGYATKWVKLRYMTSINIVALSKNFSWWGGAFPVPNVPNTLTCLFKVYFPHTGYPTNGKHIEKWAKIWGIVSIQYFLFSQQRFSIWGVAFWEHFVPNT